VLRTNAGLECAFRANLDDAKTLAHALPTAISKAKVGEARLELVAELTRMPDREYLLWLKQAPFRAQRVRSPRLDLAALRRTASRVSEETRGRMRRGVVSMEREALEASAAAEWARIEAGRELDTPTINPQARRRHPRLG
jgi:hypothetical protein